MTAAELLENLKQNKSVWEVLNNATSLGLKNWFVGAGAVCQTVWNIRHGNHAAKFIKDLDLVYYDSSDLSATAERAAQATARELFCHLQIPIDVTNQIMDVADRLQSPFENEGVRPVDFHHLQGSTLRDSQEFSDRGHHRVRPGVLGSGHPRDGRLDRIGTTEV